MKKIRRISADRPFSLCVQPAFLIGTKNEDGTPDFARITWVSATCGQGEDYLLVISMFGGKRTRRNVERSGVLSANLVSVDMLPIMDYCGTRHAGDGKMDAFPWGIGRGEKVDVPTLDASRWVYECEVEKTVEIGQSATFFCRIRNIQIDAAVRFQDAFDVDLTKLDPVIYSGKYHNIGKMLGCIGDFSTQMGDEKQ